MPTATTCPERRISLDFKPPAPTLLGRLGDAMRRRWEAYWDHRARAATVLILRSLDERTLRDIGICRGEIQSCVYGERRDRKRAYIASWRF